MRHLRMALLALVITRPALAGIVATLLGVGLGLAVATQGVTLREGTSPQPGAAFAVERAFPTGEAAVAPGPIADFALTDQDRHRVRWRD